MSVVSCVVVTGQGYPEATGANHAHRRLPRTTRGYDAGMPSRDLTSIAATFPNVPASAAAARRFVTASLRRMEVDDRTIWRAVLAASELVAEEVGRGATAAHVVVRATPAGGARIEVYDVDETRRDDHDRAGLRSQILAAVAHRRGSRRRPKGVLVWVEIEPND